MFGRYAFPALGWILPDRRFGDWAVEEIRNGLDHLSGAKHTNMDRGDIEISYQFLEDIGNQRRVDGLDPLYPRRGLHRQGGDARYAVAGMRGNRLDVSRYSSSGRWVKSGDGEYDRWFLCHGHRFWAF